MRRFATTALTRAGYQVHAAGDGAEALALFRAHAGEISVAVLDVVMPY